MDKNSSYSAPASDDVRSVIRELREDVARHEQLLAKILAYLPQQMAQWIADGLPPSWMPRQEKGNAMAPIPCLKTRKLEDLQITSNDAVAGLRNTWLGRAYLRYLKQFGMIRRIAQWLWRHGYPIYVNQISARIFDRKAKRWRAIARMDEFARKHGTSIQMLSEAEPVETPEPGVYPGSDHHCLDSSRGRYLFPKIFVTRIDHAMTYGGTNLILADGEVICHDLYDFARDYTSEELHGRTLIDPESGRARWLLHDKAPVSIPAAAVFVDACALNYAHWMTEVLPRIALFCAEDRFDGIPIVVNDGLHKNILESLSLVAGSERDIIPLPIGRALAVNQLYVTSAAGYVPFDRRTNKLRDHSHGMFSPRAFDRLRKHLNAFVQGAGTEAWPEKIFLRRNSGTRKVANAAELEKLLLARGYVPVEPERLTFLQQVRLFHHARAIVSPTGAALANAICCQPGARVAVLMGKHENMIYRYWSNLLGPLGIRVAYALGEITGNHDLGIHADFAVSADSLDALLADWESR